MSRRIVPLQGVKIGNSRFLLAPSGLFVVALAVHAAVLLQYGADPFSSTYIADALSYHESAARIAERGLAAEPVFHQSPLFPLLLSRVYVLAPPADRALWSAALLIALNSAAIALLVPLGRAYLESIPAGRVAALLALCHGPLVFYGLKLLPGPLALLTQAAGLLALDRARRSGKSFTAGCAGLLWGLACLARSEALLFVPVALWVLAKSTPRRHWPPLAAYLAGAVLAIAPVTLHNVRHGNLVLVASASGENLFIGNQRGASGGHTPLTPQAGDIFSQRALAEMLAERDSGGPLRPSEVSRYWRERALDEIAADPLGWLGLLGSKLKRILHPGDPTDLYSFALERAHYLTLLHVLAVTPWFLLVLAGAGLTVVVRHRLRSAWPLAAWIALQIAVLLVFFVDTRLRLPVYFFLTPFGGYAIVVGARSWRRGAHRALVLAVALAALAAIVAGIAATRTVPRDLVRLASVLSLKGRPEDGLRVLDPELARARPDAVVLSTAGWLLQKQGQFEQARDRYLQALAADLSPVRIPQVRTRLAKVHENLDELEQATAEHASAVASPHADAGAYYERAAFLLRQKKDPATAEHDLREAIRLDPGFAAPRELLDSLERDRRRASSGTGRR